MISNLVKDFLDARESHTVFLSWDSSSWQIA